MITKKTYTLRTAAKSMLMITTLAMLASTTACSKSDPENDENSELYTPPANISSAQIMELIGHAHGKLSGENTFTMTSLRTVTEEGDVITTKAKEQHIYNVSAKKALVIEYDLLTSPETLYWFSYIEGTTEYEYYAGKDADPSYKKRRKVTDTYFDYMSLNTVFFSDPKDYSWKVEGQKLVGTQTSENRIKIYTITLTKDMQYHTVNDTRSYTNNDVKGTTEDFTFDYSATMPSMPNGFNTSDFTPVAQFSVKVVWGEGFGETMFYFIHSSENRAYASMDEISRYSPGISGKTKEFYTDAAFTNKVDSSTSIVLTDNNTVLYVKWVIK